MIEARQVVKYFGGTQALKGVSFHIDKGEIVGFLGRNGAGKTTLMRVLTSYLPMSAGRVSIDGLDVGRQSMAVRRKIGYLPESPPLYPEMSVREYLRFAARLRDVAAKRLRVQMDKVLDQCHLRGVETKTIGQLSKGYQQRVGIAQAIVHDPSILILDEPTNGLDPVQVRQVRQLIQNVEERRTVIVSTHILSEIELIAQRVLIIHDGRLAVDSPLGQLVTAENGTRLGLEDVFVKLTQDGAP